MSKRFGRFARQNAIALLALFLALGGTSFAAATIVLPKNSVGTKQIKNGAVTKAKINKKTIAALKGNRGAAGPQGPAGPQGAQGIQGVKGDPGAPATRLWARVLGNGTLNGGSGVTNVARTAAGRYTITFNQDVSACAWVAMPVFRPGFGWGAITQGNSDGDPTHVVVYTSLDTSTTVDEPFDLAVFC